MEMELLLSKERILELYFNYVEFGKGIYGIGQGSLFYFNRSFYESGYSTNVKNAYNTSKSS